MNQKLNAIRNWGLGMNRRNMPLDVFGKNNYIMTTLLYTNPGVLNSKKTPGPHETESKVWQAALKN